MWIGASSPVSAPTVVPAPKDISARLTGLRDVRLVCRRNICYCHNNNNGQHWGFVMPDTESHMELAHTRAWGELIREWKCAMPERQRIYDKFCDLKRVVADDLDGFRLVFPEFTPHDISLHADRLVRLADAIFAPIMCRLSVVEYLVLTAAVYAHDWGMSVSDEEKKTILMVAFSGTQGDTSTRVRPEVHLIPEEARRFLTYLNQLSDTHEGKVPREPTAEEWTGYLRSTHGRRSGARIRAFFDDTHRRLGEYVALVAEGHTATEEEIANSESYRCEASSIVGDPGSVNLQALAVYLRLLDLFDISDERTPFALWRFVNPQNRDSQLEWLKHLSLAPVHLSGNSGALLFQGEVSDPDVWARVCDLRKYCEQQFSFSLALLGRMPGDKYRLPFYWLDWGNVIPKGIPSEVIRFEFERDTIFALLSEEVYDRDPYVFIRELLQNAIDAMATRAMVLARKQASLPTFSPIVVECNPLPEGDYTFVIGDMGTGMDSFIVQHYLAIVGRSFYRSSDFRKLGIQYDAISRFGIGILSCFMVADTLEIDTRPDLNVFPDSMPLRIRIDNMKNHWAVTHGEIGGAVGTTVKVRVVARKVAYLQEKVPDVSLRERGLTRSRLAVTRYLQTVAGFVKYPILVNEGGVKTAILHPEFDESLLPEEIRRTYEIKKLGMEYPISRAVTPGSVEAASHFFRVETVHVRKDLGLSDLDGSISFPVPVDQNFLVTHGGRQNITSEKDISFFSYQTGFINRRASSLCESAARDQFVACFSNGIFVPGVDYPPQLLWDENKGNREEKCGASNLWGLQVFLNHQHGRLNAARSRLLGQVNWADEALAAVGHYYASLWRDELLAATPLRRLRLLSRYGQFYPVSLFKIADAIGVENWPVCVLGSEGRVDVLSWGEFACDVVATVPKVLEEVCSLKVEQLLLGKDDVSISLLRKWDGLPMLVGPWSNWIGCSHYKPLSRMPLLKLGYESETRWVTPPFLGLPPVEQEIWTKSNRGETVRECPLGKPTRAEMKKAAKGWCRFDHTDDGRYPSVFSNYCFWGSLVVNARHELGSALLDVVLLAEQIPGLSWRTPAGDRVMHWFSRLLRRNSGLRGDNIDFSTMDQNLKALSELVKPHSPVLAERLSRHKTSRADFLPGVFFVRKDGTLGNWQYGDHHSQDGVPLANVLQQEPSGPWGRLLGPDTPWPMWSDVERLSSLEDTADLQ